MVKCKNIFEKKEERREKLPQETLGDQLYNYAHKKFLQKGK